MFFALKNFMRSNKQTVGSHESKFSQFSSVPADGDRIISKNIARQFPVHFHTQ